MKEKDHLKRIGILGGSFDPVHIGHINIARSAYEEYSLEEVWFIPAGHSPNKDEKGMTDADMRAEMVALAIEDYPCFKLSKIELESEETSYTYRTLEKLKQLYPTYQFYFIMGADSLDYLEKWAHPEIICRNAIILVALRDDCDIAWIQEKTNQLQQLFSAQIYPLYGGYTQISSTRLREAVKSGKWEETMLSPKVMEYILEHHLYEHI